jgi:hypothetical protein
MLHIPAMKFVDISPDTDLFLAFIAFQIFGISMAMHPDTHFLFGAPVSWVVGVPTLALAIFGLSKYPRIPETFWNIVGTLICFLRWPLVSHSIVLAIGTMHWYDIKYFANSFLALEFNQRAFIWLFLWKFVKVVVHVISYVTYTPYQRKKYSRYGKNDVTVVIPTVGDLDDEFVECMSSIVANQPKRIMVVTVGNAKLQLAKRVCEKHWPGKIEVMATVKASKRKQLLEAVKKIKTDITISADDHVFWPNTFLKSALTPFDDAHVGLVGTVKRVRRINAKSYTLEDILNYIAVIYLERHNYECTATSHIDDGVFVISGRTQLLRTDMVKDENFAKAYAHETWAYNTCGPLNVDDDNFVARWAWSAGWKTVFHNEPAACLETNLGIAGGWKKFSGQLNRWARTTWRSNSTELFVDRHVWPLQPWSVYATYMATFVNISPVYDPLLIYTLAYSSWGSATNICWLVIILFLSKCIKPLPHWLRTPRDLMYIPIIMTFGYYHGFVRLYALWTARNDAWGTRDLTTCEEPGAIEPEEDYFTFHRRYDQKLRKRRNSAPATPGFQYLTPADADSLTSPKVDPLSESLELRIQGILTPKSPRRATVHFEPLGPTESSVPGQPGFAVTTRRISLAELNLNSKNSSTEVSPKSASLPENKEN